MILVMRTDKPEAEIGLYDGDTRVDYKIWQADRNLSAQIHMELNDILNRNKSTWHDISAIVFYEGPGSFTGLRIGASIASTLASELDITISGAGGEDWISEGLSGLKTNPQQRLVEVKYGRPPHITKPRK